MKKFLLINPFGIGDVLFTTPLIKAIKEHDANTRIGYWCNERVKQIFVSDPNIDKVFALSRGDLKKYFNISKLKGIKKSFELLSDLKKEKYDIALDFSLDHRYALIAKLAGIKNRTGYNYKNRGRLLTHKIDIRGYNSKHIVEYYLELLKFIGIIPKAKNLSLFISPGNKTQAKSILSSLGVKEGDLLVGIAAGAGASWGKEAYLKHWPADNFARLAERIAKEYKAKIVILGDDKEKNIAQAIIKVAQTKVIDLVGKTNLAQFIGVVSSLNLLITNDGGPLHIAVACQVNTVSIFGPVSEQIYGPYPPSPSHIVVKKDLSCRPCYNNFRLVECRANRKCIEDITVDEVFAAVKKLL